jgi:hypothetical protein
MAEKDKDKFEYKHGFRHGPTIIGLAIIYYIIFGILSNYWEKGLLDHRPLDDNVLFIYRNLLNLPHQYYATLDRAWYNDFGTWYIFLIFLATAIYVGYSQDFLIYSVKRNMWMVPIIVVLSIFWNGLNDVYYYRSFFRNGSFIYTIFMNAADYFTSIHGYINILVLFVFLVGGGLIGGYLKIVRRERLRRKAKLMLREEASK